MNLEIFISFGASGTSRTPKLASVEKDTQILILKMYEFLTKVIRVYV